MDKSVLGDCCWGIVDDFVVAFVDVVSVVDFFESVDFFFFFVFFLFDVLSSIGSVSDVYVIWRKSISKSLIEICITCIVNNHSS